MSDNLLNYGLYKDIIRPAVPIIKEVVELSIGGYKLIKEKQAENNPEEAHQGGIDNSMKAGSAFKLEDDYMIAKARVYNDAKNNKRGK